MCVLWCVVVVCGKNQIKKEICPSAAAPLAAAAAAAAAPRSSPLSALPSYMYYAYIRDTH